MAEKRIHNKIEAAESMKEFILGQLDPSLFSREDMHLLQAWMDEHPEDRAAFDKINDPEKLLIAIEQIRNLISENPTAYQELLSRIGETERPRIRRLVYYMTGIAASLLLVAGSFFLVKHSHLPETTKRATVAQVRDVLPGSYKATVTLANGNTIVLDSLHSGLIAQQGNSHLVNQAGGQLSYQVKGSQESMVYNTVTTGRGNQYQVLLGDGTRVWLDAASRLRFPTAFNGPTREVELDGQGYFEVKHRKEPFIVHTSRKTDIIDLGTSFNVNAYSDEPAVQTTLLKGSVKVEAGGQSRLLIPGQQAISGESANLMVKELDDPEGIAAWKDGQFEFSNTDLKEGMRKIARWYDVTVEYQGNVEGRGITGSAPLNENLSVLIRVLNATGIHCRLEEKKIVVMP